MSWLAKLLSGLLVASIGLVAVRAVEPDAAEYRTWTKTPGSIKIQARFEKFEDGKVFLKRKDTGKTIQTPLEKLSKSDQAFVRRLSDGETPGATGSDTAKGKGAKAPVAWVGMWNNQKYGTNGPLKCTAAPVDEKSWDAKFEGTGMGKAFSYDVKIETLAKDGRTLLQGASTVSGDRYQWTGYVSGNELHGSYRSASGNNGEFVLQESRE